MAGLKCGVQLIDKLDASTPSRENPSSGAAIWFGPGREKVAGIHPPMGQMRGVRMLVFVFWSGENRISGISNRALRERKSLQQSRESELGKFHNGGF